MSNLSKQNAEVFERLYGNATAPKNYVWHQSEPTAFIREIIASRPPGRALDLACNTGVNSVYLAQHGWQVKSLDFVPEALNLTRKRAAEAGVKLSMERTDITIWTGDGRFDLIVDSGCLHSLRMSFRQEYKDKLLVWLNPGGDYVLRHAERRGLLDWRPMGPRRVSRARVQQLFRPKLIEHNYQQRLFTGVKLPFGLSYAQSTYWFKLKT